MELWDFFVHKAKLTQTMVLVFMHEAYYITTYLLCTYIHCKFLDLCPAPVKFRIPHLYKEQDKEVDYNVSLNYCTLVYNSFT